MPMLPRNVPNPTSQPGGSAGGPEPSAGEFTQTLLRSRLLTRAELDAAAAGRPGGRTSARELADHLITAGMLTHYQAEKLLRGLFQGLVLGPYHVLAPLGRGGMGTVYLARDTRLPADGTDSSLVALKVLPPKRAREEERTLARFRREMELGRHLAHPNVTRTFDAGEENGVHFIVMEYVPGRSLRQLVSKDGPLPVPDATRVAADVAAGLAHAHRRGLIHRDLKPSNIMVTPDGRAKILDLGLALLLDESLPADPRVVGGEGYILGTMDYIAPEQAADATNVGPWSDLYALGCSLYFALTGTPPFPGGTSRQKRRWHQTAEPVPVTEINPAVPVALARLVGHMMAKRPEDRPASAEAVRKQLLTWAGDPTPAAPPPPHTDRETVAEYDDRAVDPSLWEATPIPQPRPDRDGAIGAGEEGERTAGPDLTTLLGLAAAVVGLVGLVGLLLALRML